MTEFETIYITHPDLDETSFKALGEKLQAVCTRSGSHLLHYRDWGVRKLAYEVKKNRRGHYFYVNYLGESNMVPEVERNLRYDEKVLRYMTVQVGKVEDVPARLESAKTQKDVAAPQDAVEAQVRGRGRSRGADDDFGADIEDAPDLN